MTADVETLDTEGSDASEASANAEAADVLFLAVSSSLVDVEVEPGLLVLNEETLPVTGSTCWK